MTEQIDKTFNTVFQELKQAQSKFPPIYSPHEGFAVIKEELDELWDAVKQNDQTKALQEAKQIAAMAIRFILDLTDLERQSK